jgi:hypothetical protein
MNWPGKQLLLRQSTPQLLRRLCTGLLAMVTVTVAGCLGTFLGARNAVVSVDHRVLPATTSLAKIWTDLYQVDVSLAKCDPSGATAQRSDCLVVLAAGEYHSQLAEVVQRIAVLAQQDIGNSGDRQTLQVVQGLLIRYLGLVEEAHFYLGQNMALLAGAYLSYASDLLRGSIKYELDTYRNAVGDALKEQRGSPWGAAWTMLIWVVPLMVTLLLLMVTQWYLVVRFNRWLNWPLATATSALVLLGMAAAQPRWTDAGFDRASGRLKLLVSAPLPADDKVSGPSAHLIAQLDNAARSYRLEYLMIALAVLALVLIVVGLQRRIEEYQVRSR